MAEKKNCPQCPAPFVWNKNSRAHFAFLMLVTIVPLIVLFLLVMFLFFEPLFVR